MAWTMKISKDLEIKFNDKGEILKGLSNIPNELKEVLEDKEVKQAIEQHQKTTKKGCGCWSSQ